MGRTLKKPMTGAKHMAQLARRLRNRFLVKQANDDGVSVKCFLFHVCGLYVVINCSAPASAVITQVVVRGDLRL